MARLRVTWKMVVPWAHPLQVGEFLLFDVPKMSERKQYQEVKLPYFSRFVWVNLGDCCSVCVRNGTFWDGAVLVDGCVTMPGCILKKPDNVKKGTIFFSFRRMFIHDHPTRWMTGSVIQDLILKAGLNRRHELLFQAGPANLGNSLAKECLGGSNM